MVLGTKLFGIEVPERVAGVDIMTELFRICAERGFRPYLLGAEKSVLDAVDRRLARDYPGLVVAGMQDGYLQAGRRGGRGRGDQREPRRLPVRRHADAAQGAVPRSSIATC